MMRNEGAKWRSHGSAKLKPRIGKAKVERRKLMTNDMTLADRVAELEASLKRWETAAANGSIYTRKDLEEAVSAALEEAAEIEKGET